MTRLRWMTLLLALAPCCLWTVGCSSKSADSGDPSNSGSSDSRSSDQDGGSPADSTEAVSAADLPDTLIEPFDPPTLEEIDSKAEWVDQPVVDALALRRKLDAETKPLVPTNKALKLKNTSPQSNQDILSALGRTAPADGAGVNWNATISRALTLDLRSTNPILASSISESELISLTGFGLFSFDWDMIPFASADTVVSWQTSKDRMMDKVIIRDDLTWSDGTPITAHDIVFSFQTIMNPKVPVPAQRSGTDGLRWIEAYDNYTLVYYHKKPSATNIWNLNFSVIPKHLYEDSVADDTTLTENEHHSKLEKSPVTGGPYEYLKRVRGQEIILGRRESYYMHEGKQVRDKPYFAHIRFRVLEDANTRLLALQSGEIEEAELGHEQWKTQTAGSDFYKLNTKITGTEWTFFYIGWNMKTPYFADKRVRQAMSYALNHEEMLNDLCYGLYEPGMGIYHPTAWMYPKKKLKRYQQDLDKAEDLLDAAGWVDTDGDGVRDKTINGKKIPFEFKLMVSNKPDRIAICNLLRENLDSIGVICKVRPQEAAVFQEQMFHKQFQAAFSGWGAGADPYTSKNIWGTGEERNYCSFSNKEVDDLFLQGEAEFDREKRAAIYGRVHEIIYEEQPYTFLYYRSSFYGFNKKLRGYMFSPRGPFHYSPGFSSIWAAEK